jgi:proteic killer suppression protein
VIRSYRSKALKKFAVDGDASKLPVQNADRIRLLLSRLDASVKPEDMNLPGFGFHGLQGKPRRYAVTASANYRITFGWEGEDAVAVDLEDYH